MTQTKEERAAYNKKYRQEVTLKKISEDPEYAARINASCLRSYYKNREAVLPKMRQRSKERFANDRRLALYEGAKRRAKLDGLAFDITIDDIVIPTVCPVLGIPIETGHGPNHPNLPSLDKFDPTKGYVRDNITVISYRANSLKRDATTGEVALLLSWMQSWPQPSCNSQSK